MNGEECGWPPQYTVRRSKKARRVFWRISDAAGLELVVPEKARMPGLPGLLGTHRAWLEKHLALRERRLSGRKALQRENPFAPPAGFWLHGGELRIDLDIDKGLGGAAMHDLLGGLPASGVALWPLAAGSEKELWQRLGVCLKAYARLYLSARFAAVSDASGLSCASLRFGMQKSRWGSYAVKGLVRLNYKLVFLPQVLSDYVILHELCHSVHPCHNSAFWGLMQEKDPESRKNNLELQQAEIWIPHWFN